MHPKAKEYFRESWMNQLNDPVFIKVYLETMSAEERLKGLTDEQRLHGLMLRLRALGFTADEAGAEAERRGINDEPADAP